jgi:small-conductance mechanosensitive channel
MADIFDDLRLLPLLDQEWAGNTLLRVAAALGIFLAATIVFVVALPFAFRALERFARRTSSSADDAIAAFALHIPRRLLLVLAFFQGAWVLRLPAAGETAVKGGILVILTYIGVSASRLAIELALVAGAPGLRTGDARQLPPVLRITLLMALWTIGIVLILSNLGVNVISLVAGLGIGGIAIALAVQNILGDMFSSFALYLDKPFRPGDFIVTGPHMGVVKQVGLKTTRIQSLEGEEIVISNQELTSSRIQNYKRMKERRVEFAFRVTYDTAPASLRALPGIVRGIVESRPKTRFGRAHVAAFEEWGLKVTVVYTVESADYDAFMDIQQDINLLLLEKLAEAGISIALPARTVLLGNAAA